MDRKQLKEQVTREVARQMGLPVREVRDIVDSQFDTVRRVIELGDFQSVKLDYFGKFLAKPKRVQLLNDRHRLKRDGPIQGRKSRSSNRS